MRRFTLVLIAGLLLGCHPTTDVHGIYVGDHGEGVFFPCDDPTIIVRVPDSTLAATYRLLAGESHQPVYVQLRGVRGHAGSIYGGPRYFLVHQVLEIRARGAGECPKVARSPSPWFRSAADSARSLSTDSVLAMLEAYAHRRIPADTAARIVLDYLRDNGTLNVELDANLRRAINRELRKRHAQGSL